MSATPASLEQQLASRLGRGEHLILKGPRGSGKTRLVANLQHHFDEVNVPCSISAATHCLNDITEAFSSAYPAVATSGLPRRQARSRLCLTADDRRGVLLLDHVTDVSKAMVGFLRRLRGGVLGVLLVVDVDNEREQQQLRAWHVGSLSVRMPRHSVDYLRGLLRSECAARGIELERRTSTYLLRAAHGRPGWVIRCAHLVAQGRYYREGRLMLHVLTFETEWGLRGDDAGIGAFSIARIAVGKGRPE